MFTRAGQALLIAVALFATGVATARAEQSAIQFWLQQYGAAPAESRPARHPVFRPRPAPTPASGRTDRRPSPGRVAGSGSVPVKTATAAKPAFVIGVFGDSFGFDAARGLADRLAGNPRTEVADETDGSASLAGPALPEALAAALKQAGRVDAAVVMLGADDPRPLTDARGAAVAPDSPDWPQVYGARIKAVAAVFADRRIPLIWVGLPVVRDDDRARRNAGLNAILREQAAAAGLTYVDAWDAFADENGHFAMTGPDENGQPAKLRRDDGVRFTRTGAHKLASFIEPELKPIRDKLTASNELATLARPDTELFDQALTVDVTAQIRREAGLPPVPGPEADTNGPVLELTAAPFAQNGRLAGPETPLGLDARAEAVLVSGLVPAPRRGRADDFSWPQPSPSR